MFTDLLKHSEQGTQCGSTDTNIVQGWPRFIYSRCTEIGTCTPSSTFPLISSWKYGNLTLFFVTLERKWNYTEKEGEVKVGGGYFFEHQLFVHHSDLILALSWFYFIFIEMKHICNTISHFKVHSFVAFSVFMMLCNHHLLPVSKPLYHPRKAHHIY